MSDVALFGSPLSPFVKKVVRALHLKGMTYTLVEPRSPGDFKRWSPLTQKMPVLELDGERIYDSTFILRRLEALRPEPPLVSSDAAVAAAQRLFEDWADESLYWHVQALRWSPENRGRSMAQILRSVPPLLRPLVRSMIKRKLARAPWVQGLGRLPYEILTREIGMRLDEVGAILGDGTYLYSDRVSIADLALFGMLGSLTSDATPEGKVLLGERPSLQGYVERVDRATADPNSEGRAA